MLNLSKGVKGYPISKMNMIVRQEILKMARISLSGGKMKTNGTISNIERE